MPTAGTPEFFDDFVKFHGLKGLRKYRFDITYELEQATKRLEDAVEKQHKHLAKSQPDQQALSETAHTIHHWKRIIDDYEKKLGLAQDALQRNAAQGTPQKDIAGRSGTIRLGQNTKDANMALSQDELDRIGSTLNKVLTSMRNQIQMSKIKEKEELQRRNIKRVNDITSALPSAEFKAGDLGDPIEYFRALVDALLSIDRNDLGKKLLAAISVNLTTKIDKDPEEKLENFWPIMMQPVGPERSMRTTNTLVNDDPSYDWTTKKQKCVYTPTAQTKYLIFVGNPENLAYRPEGKAPRQKLDSFPVQFTNNGSNYNLLSAVIKNGGHYVSAIGKPYSIPEHGHVFDGARKEPAEPLSEMIDDINGKYIVAMLIYVKADFYNETYEQYNSLKQQNNNCYRTAALNALFSMRDVHDLLGKTYADFAPPKRPLPRGTKTKKSKTKKLRKHGLRPTQSKRKVAFFVLKDYRQSKIAGPHPDHTPYNRYFVVQHATSDEWMIPGGFVDKSDKSSYHAAVRELREESNINPEYFELASIQIDKDTGNSTFRYWAKLNAGFAALLRQQFDAIFDKREHTGETSAYGFAVVDNNNDIICIEDWDGKQIGSRPPALRNLTKKSIVNYHKYLTKQRSQGYVTPDVPYTQDSADRQVTTADTKREPIDEFIETHDADRQVTTADTQKDPIDEFVKDNATVIKVNKRGKTPSGLPFAKIHDKKKNKTFWIYPDAKGVLEFSLVDISNSGVSQQQDLDRIDRLVALENGQIDKSNFNNFLWLENGVGLAGRSVGGAVTLLVPTQLRDGKDLERDTNQLMGYGHITDDEKKHQQQAASKMHHRTIAEEQRFKNYNEMQCGYSTDNELADQKQHLLRRFPTLSKELGLVADRKWGQSFFETQVHSKELYNHKELTDVLRKKFRQNMSERQLNNVNHDGSYTNAELDMQRQHNMQKFKREKVSAILLPLGTALQTQAVLSQKEGLTTVDTDTGKRVGKTMHQLERARNAQAEQGVLTDRDLYHIQNSSQTNKMKEMQRNKARGFGSVTDRQRKAQIKKNAKQGHGEFTDFQLDEQRKHNNELSLGLIINAEKQKEEQRQRIINKTNGFGSVTDHTLQKQRKENKKLGLGPISTYELDVVQNAVIPDNESDNDDEGDVYIDADEEDASLIDNLSAKDSFGNTVRGKTQTQYDKEIATNESNGLGIIDNNEVDFQRRKNKEAGYGPITNFQHCKKVFDRDPQTNAEIQEWSSRTYGPAFNWSSQAIKTEAETKQELHTEEKEKQRQSNQAHGFGYITDEEVRDQRLENYRKKRGFFTEHELKWQMTHNFDEYGNAQCDYDRDYETLLVKEIDEWTVDDVSFWNYMEDIGLPDEKIYEKDLSGIYLRRLNEGILRETFGIDDKWEQQQILQRVEHFISNYTPGTPPHSTLEAFLLPDLRQSKWFDKIPNHEVTTKIKRELQQKMQSIQNPALRQVAQDTAKFVADNMDYICVHGGTDGCWWRFQALLLFLMLEYESSPEYQEQADAFDQQLKTGTYTSFDWTFASWCVLQIILGKNLRSVEESYNLGFSLTPDGPVWTLSRNDGTPTAPPPPIDIQAIKRFLIPNSGSLGSPMWFDTIPEHKLTQRLEMTISKKIEKIDNVHLKNYAIMELRELKMTMNDIRRDGNQAGCIWRTRAFKLYYLIFNNARAKYSTTQVRIQNDLESGNYVIFDYRFCFWIISQIEQGNDLQTLSGKYGLEYYFMALGPIWASFNKIADNLIEYRDSYHWGQQTVPNIHTLYARVVNDKLRRRDPRYGVYATNVCNAINEVNEGDEEADDKLVLNIMCFCDFLYYFKKYTQEDCKLILIEIIREYGSKLHEMPIDKYIRWYALMKLQHNDPEQTLRDQNVKLNYTNDGNPPTLSSTKPVIRLANFSLGDEQNDSGEETVVESDPDKDDFFSGTESGSDSEKPSVSQFTKGLGWGMPRTNDIFFSGDIGSESDSGTDTDSDSKKPSLSQFYEAVGENDSD